MTPEVEIVVPSDPRWLRVIRSVVQEFAEEIACNSQERREIALAVGEAVSNVIKHSYKGDPSRKLTLICRNPNARFEVEIRDEGEPFDAGTLIVRPPEEIRVGGRGVYLMRAVMDEVEYVRKGDTNCVRMSKMLQVHAR